MSCPLCPAALARPRPYSGPAALLRGLGKGLWRRDLLGGGPLAPACCLQSPGPTRASPNHKAHWLGHGGQVASALSHPGAAGRGPTSLPRGRARWAGWGDPGGGSEVYPSPSPQPQASRSPRSRIPGEALGLLGPVRPPALCSAGQAAAATVGTAKQTQDRTFIAEHKVPARKARLAVSPAAGGLREDRADIARGSPARHPSGQG